MLRLGPFELQFPIGTGGMGEVWRAVHADGVPVAVKVVRDADEAYREAFLHEVRLVAGLRHRNVVMALDAGTVPEATAVASEGRLRAGSPFLAMELAGGGSLARARLPGWTALVHVLDQLLLGLAHAHARGVLHRDVKPANLLVAGERGELASEPGDVGAARIVVTDFGIGAAGDPRRFFEGGRSMGTPSYMAPEQVEAKWRDHGPWTDLYAVGVVAFQLATGAVPFVFPHPSRVLYAHVRDPVPPMRTLFDVPPAFEAWVRQLLAKRPADRFAFATDARRALHALGEPAPERRRARRPASEVEAPTEPVAVPEVEISRTGGRPRLGTTGPVVRASPDGGGELRLEGAGLGLYGLRALPMVDRAVERDRLWGELVRVRTTGEARVVVLRGPSGTGKSRLVEWLSHTAHEVGAAVTMGGVHAAQVGAEPLARLAEGVLRCDGLTAAEAVARVEDLLQPDDRQAAQALAELVAPSGAEPPTRREVHAAMERLLRAVAGERTVVVWLDDAQDTPDVLAFAARLLRAADPVPALVLATVQQESLAERPEASDALRELLAEERASEVLVGPLGAEDHRELVRELLGLEGSLAERVEERTGGNPLFAVQLVGDWVGRGLLVPSERGFRLRGDVPPALPGDMVAVWQERVGRFLDGRSEDDARALELAATLGLEVEVADLRACSALAGVGPAADLADALMKRRLAMPVAGSRRRWAFVHGMLREVLLARARAGGRDRDHHRTAAAHLRATGAPDPERLARHLLAAGAFEDALGPLGQAVGQRLARGDFRSSALVTAHEQALEALGVPHEDARWAEVWLAWAWLFRVRGDLGEAERWAVRTERAARRHGWREALGRALRLSARIERNRGRTDQAVTLIAEAEEVFAALGDARRAADCRVLKGDLWLLRSDLDRAAEAFRSAVGGTGEDADAWLGLAKCAQRGADTSAFVAALDAARGAAERAGRRNVLAAVANLQGELARHRGDVALAEKLYREAAARYRALDDADQVYAQLNVGLLLALRGAFAECVALVEPLLERAERGGARSVPACFAHAVLWPCAAGMEEWDRFEAHAAWLEAFLAERALFDADLARMAALAARLAADAGRGVLAERARAVAEAQERGQQGHG